MFTSVFFLLLGVFSGLWISWPGLLVIDNYSCARELIVKSRKNQSDIRSFLSIPPKYLLRNKKITKLDEIRLLADTCFR